MVRDGICGESAHGLKNGCSRFKLILCCFLPNISPRTKFHPNWMKNTEVENFHFWSILVGRAGRSKNGRNHFKHSESDKRLTNDLCTKYEPNRMKNGQVSPFWNFFSKIEIWLVGPVCMSEIGSRIRIQSTWSWQVSMQKINSIAQSVLELSHCENADNDNDNDTHPGWIIVRVGRYSVADKKKRLIGLDREDWAWFIFICSRHHFFRF